VTERKKGDAPFASATRAQPQADGDPQPTAEGASPVAGGVQPPDEKESGRRREGKNRAGKNEAGKSGKR
jgi:hypothetical protein